MSEVASLMCPHSDHCSVCSWIQHTSSEQKQRKIQSLKDSLEVASIVIPERLDFYSAGLGGIRDRVDLTYWHGKYGFFQRQTREIFSLEACPLMSPGLFTYFQDVQKISLPIEKGSLRLRFSPSGEKGVWLDFANEDIRDLLAEKKTLQAFLDLGFVEIGQRRKKLLPTMKLSDPEFHLWTRTWVQERALDLFSLVGSFSQSGDAANRLIIREMERLFELCESQNWIEFGAGSGNLTFPLARKSRSVQALEFEGLALEGLQKSLLQHSDFQGRIEIAQGDFQRKAKAFFKKDQGVLVNPPRSGLQKFLDPLSDLPTSERPRDFVYMSCFLESFVLDGKRLKDLGYGLKDLSIVDQFPNSPHFEILSRWQLS